MLTVVTLREPSIVFALLGVEALGEGAAEVRRAVAAVSFTVMASVVLHGVTASPGARRFLQSEREVPDHASRSRAAGLLRRHRAE